MEISKAVNTAIATHFKFDVDKDLHVKMKNI